MNIDYPYHIDTRGRTGLTDNDEHIRDMIEQVLFTSPGERVNRPTFGSGLIQLVFEPNSDVLAAAVQASVQAALQQWLADLISVDAVQITNRDSILYAEVRYVLRRNQQQRIVRFQRRV